MSAMCWKKQKGRRVEANRSRHTCI